METAGWRVDVLPRLDLPALDGLVLCGNPARLVGENRTEVWSTFLPMAREKLIGAALQRAALPTVGLVTIHWRDVAEAQTAAAFALGQQVWKLARPVELVLASEKPEESTVARFGGRLVAREVSVPLLGGTRRHRETVWEVMSPARHAEWRAASDR